MSIQTDTPTGTCKHCQTDFPLPGIQRDYCSEECLYSAKGEKALNTIKQDHTTCSTCGRIRARVDPPKPDDQFAIEESYGAAWNCNAEGVVSYEKFTQAESAKAAIGRREATMNEEEGNHCCCGTIERTGDGHFDILGNIETFDTLLRIHQRIKEAAYDGQRDTWPRKAQFFKSFRETEDLAYSVGVSLE